MSAKGRLLKYVIKWILVSAVAVCLASCSFIPRDQFNETEQAIAQIPGLPGVRVWADAGPAEFQKFVNGARLHAAIEATGRFDVLALSGGGSDGAYGAGIVNGWTATGHRPKFTIVTGVSAGALIAPLAFAGPEYDATLERAFTSGVSQVLGDAGILTLLGSADIRRANLLSVIGQFVDRRLLQVIAAEYARGRHLLVVTTNLDAQRPVIWDMGAIAASGHPDALQLFIEVLAASASIPGVFAPALIEVEANGRRFREMHVDGGVSTQVFIVPDALLISGMRVSTSKSLRTTVWVVVNNHLTPQFEVVESGILPIVSRSVSSLIKSDTRKTLLSTLTYIGRENFNLTYINDGFKDFLRKSDTPDATAGFNTPYMKVLFAYGYERAVSGRAWERQIPIADPLKARVRSIAADLR